MAAAGKGWGLSGGTGLLGRGVGREKQMKFVVYNIKLKVQNLHYHRKKPEVLNILFIPEYIYF